MHKKNPASSVSAESGLSLLELILAIAVVMISVSALVAIANSANRSVATSRGHTIADQYVRGGIEIIRNYRDNYGWEALLDPGTEGGPDELVDGEAQYYAIAADGSISYQSISGSVQLPCPMINNSTHALGGGYFRVARMALDGEELTIKVTVCFDYRPNGSSQNQDATTMLTNW